ncbi:hypothetical protein [Shewanella algicola]|uniref:hypothetical protein n=1 Tax=Shewanella algicola TaxID=640633 RepID=UPI0024948CAF|nr:hypothetical protein [Shewanella algicola]
MYNPNNSIYSTSHFDENPPIQNYQEAVNEHYKPAHQDLNKPRYSGAFKEFFSLKCHGKKAAIELKPSITRTSEWETVMLESATSIGPKQFDWSQKSSLQITKTELPHVISVFLGIKEKFEGRSHGPQKNKGFSMSWQTNGNSTNLFVCVTEAGKPAMAVPISGMDAMMLGHMACLQYIRNFPGMTVDACIKSLEIMSRHNV